jgi:peptidoglycan/xylan/chitin deacetylase (PgdA/CDA1 family)
MRADAVRLGAPLYYRGLRAFGVTVASRRLQNGGLILCYHNVVQAGERGGEPGLHVPRERFEHQMRWLASQYAVVPLSEFVDRLRSGASLRRVAAVTFDDGYAGVFGHALPILDALRMPATMFLVADAVGRSDGFWWDEPEIVDAATPMRRERWLNELRGDGAAIVSEQRRSAQRPLPASHRPAGWAAIRAWVDRGIAIGVHSATHRSLPTLTDSELEDEITGSRATLHRATGIRAQFFAYPYGHWNARVRALVHAAGYRAALALGTGLNGPTTDPWCLRRVNVPAGISDEAFDAWTAGFHARRSG